MVPILVSFFLNYFLCKNIIFTIVGILPALFFFASPSHYIELKNLFKIFYVLINILLSFFLGCMANINLVLSIVLNLCIPFILVCFFSDEKRINGFMFYYAMFIGAQFVKLSVKSFGICSLTVFIGFIIPFIFKELYMFMHKNYKIRKTKDFSLFISEKIQFNLVRLKKSLDLKLLSSRFAIRISIATALTIVLWKYLDMPKWNWLTIATCCTLYPIDQNVPSRVLNRIIGSMLGISAFFILVLLTNNHSVFIVTGIIAVLMMMSSMVTGHLFECYLFAAYVTLTFSCLSFNPYTAIFYKFVYTITGALLAFVLNVIIVPSGSFSDK